MRFRNYLLGATKEHEIVFTDVEIYENRNCKNEFTASFSSVFPVRESSVNLGEYVQDYVDGMGNETKLHLLEVHDCRPSELADEMINESPEFENWIDCSVYGETLNLGDNDTIHFQSMCCGQHDFRGQMEAYTNIHVFNRLCEIWDEFHLKSAPDEIVEEVKFLMKTLEETNSEEWIKDYVEKYIDDVED